MIANFEMLDIDLSRLFFLTVATAIENQIKPVLYKHGPL